MLVNIGRRSLGGGGSLLRITVPVGFDRMAEEPIRAPRLGQMQKLEKPSVLVIDHHLPAQGFKFRFGFSGH